MRLGRWTWGGGPVRPIEMPCTLQARGSEHGRVTWLVTPQTGNKFFGVAMSDMARKRAALAANLGLWSQPRAWHAAAGARGGRDGVRATTGREMREIWGDIGMHASSSSMALMCGRVWPGQDKK